MVTDEQKELIVQSYSKTFDKEMAYVKVGLTDTERAEADEDKEFQDRLAIFLIEEREKIIAKLRRFMDSEDEKTAFKATTDLAQVLYKDFFTALGKGVKDLNVNVNLNKEDPEETKRIEEEYGTLLGNPKKFKDKKTNNEG